MIMYRMNYRIEVGKLTLPILTRVTIKKDVTKLTDTATIICPAVHGKRQFAFVGKIEKWQRIKIELGYDGKLNTEFEGYVESVKADGGKVTIECQDALLLFKRVDMPNGELKDVSLKDVLQRTLARVNEFLRSEGKTTLKLNCRYDWSYDKFTFVNATAYSVMEQIQKEGAPNIYIADDTLNIVPQYTDTTGKAVYSMQSNIRKDGMNLKWRDENDQPLLVTASGTLTNGTKVEATAGKAGGNKIDLKFPRITDLKSLQSIADNMYRQKSYTGYEGKFSAWLVPYCDAGYAVELTDQRKSLRSGLYYVRSVTVEFSSSGSRRTLEIGSALSAV